MSETKLVSRQISDLADELSTKQDTLVSGTNIKTINNQSLLGSGNIAIAGGEGSGEANTTSNVGTGTGLALPKQGVDLPFRALRPGVGIALDIAVPGGDVLISNTSIGEANTAANKGAGQGVYSDKAGTALRFKSLVAGDNVSLASDSDTITINATGGVAGETNTASNLGGGTPVFDSKSGVDLRFRSLLPGTGISISSTPGGATTITNTATGEINTASNLGGTGLYASKTGANLNFRGLSAGQGVNLASSGTAVTIRTVYIQANDPGAVGPGVLWVQP